MSNSDALTFPPRDSGAGDRTKCGGRGAGFNDCSDPTTKRRVRSPLHHAARGPPPPLSRGQMRDLILAMRLGIRALLHASRKPVQHAPINEGGGAPKGAHFICRARRGPARAARTNVATRPRFGRARLSALHRGARRAGRIQHRLSLSPALPKTRRIGRYPLPPVLSLPRSAETGPSAGRSVARGRPGTVCETARGNRTCSTF